MSVLSSDGKTWLTKLDRIGKLSADNHDLVFNNLGLESPKFSSQR